MGYQKNFLHHPYIYLNETDLKLAHICVLKYVVAIQIGIFLFEHALT